MNVRPSTMSTGDELVNRYEKLRHQVLDRSAIDRGPGLALLIQRGMKAWMDASSICPDPSSSTTLRLSDREEVLVFEQRHQIVLVLVSMVLNRHIEANG